MSRSKSVLVVDDEEDLRGVIASEFMFRGWNVFEACCGDEALQIFLSNPVMAGV